MLIYDELNSVGPMQSGCIVYTICYCSLFEHADTCVAVNGQTVLS